VELAIFDDLLQCFCFRFHCAVLSVNVCSFLFLCETVKNGPAQRKQMGGVVFCLIRTARARSGRFLLKVSPTGRRRARTID
jgi:hypothetical protein